MDKLDIEMHIFVFRKLWWSCFTVTSIDWKYLALFAIVSLSFTVHIDTNLQ